MWLGACISKKKFTAMQNQLSTHLANTELQLNQTKTDLIDCEKEGLTLRTEVKGKQSELVNAKSQIALQQEQQDYLKKTNGNLLDRLSELSVLNKTGAENMKKTLDALDQQGKVIKELKAALAQEDSLSLNMVMALNQTISNEARNYISWGLEEGRLVLQLGPNIFEIAGEPDTSLGKIATVLGQYPDRQINVFAFYTDINQTEELNNSFKKASSIAHLLSTRFEIPFRNIKVGTQASTVLNQNIQIVLAKKTQKIDSIIDAMK
jgi:chemotaxis protein MotB